jgi:hypothetical protein
MERMTSSYVVVLSTIAACMLGCVAGGDEGTSGFPGYPTGPATGKNDAIEDSGSSESDDDDDDDDDDTSETPDDGEDSADGSTTEPHDVDTMDPDPSSGEVGEPETGVDPTGDPGPGQPAMGLWAQCTYEAYDNCTFDAPVCISAEFDGGAEDGFCSRDGCTNPAVDCAPVPTDSNATPMCVEARDEMQQSVFLCALDCALGQTCPAGMVCVEGILFADDLPIYSFCV